MTDSPLPKSPFREAIRLGWGGAKQNLLPGLLLWFFGLGLVISYYQIVAVGSLFDQIGQFKSTYSPWVAIASTAIFGSLIPWLAQFVLLPANKRQPFRHVPWLLLFWGIHGYQVDLLYILQAKVFGSGHDWATIAKKTFVDQFIWGPFLAVPQVLLAYLFVESNFSRTHLRAQLQRRSFLARVIPLLITNWVVWIPSVSLIYLFPLSLQLPLMNIILALWCLIVIFFAKNA